MPKSKSHKGLLKRIKITKSGKVRFGRPHSRHLKSNKTGEQVQTYRRKRYARSGDLKALKKILFRGLLSQEQGQIRAEAREAAAKA
ncbi:MAG: bL35 family ribosomal protein [Phycisphaerales bacterium]